MAEIKSQEVKQELWRRGNLSWKLKSSQKDLYDLYHNSKHKVQTWLISRRYGKTFSLSLIAIELCIKTPKSIVKFVSPTKNQLNTNIRPIIDSILEDCPESLKPEFRKHDYIFYFPNGSEIHLAGSEGGHAEKLRGANASLCIVDEAGICSDLTNLVKNILLPTTLITKGKVLLAGTPPKEPDHEFIKFIEEAELKGSLIRRTVRDNVMITPEMYAELIEELGGEKSDSCRRELFCELVKDTNTTVIPEFDDALEQVIVKDHPRPPFYDTYVSMDLGFKDLTVVLFGYYDFKVDKVVVEDEIVIPSSTLKLPELASKIMDKEFKLWVNPITNEVKKPIARVSDIDYIAMNELAVHSNYEINFQATKKDNKSAAINNLRVMLAAHKIIINPRCITLIRHLKNAKYKSVNNKDVFARSPDDGHYDALDACLYLIRSINYQRNPYPASWGYNIKDLYIQNPQGFYKNQTSAPEVFKQIFKIKSR